MNNEKLVWSRKEIAEKIGCNERSTYTLDLPDGFTLRNSPSAKKFWKVTDVMAWIDSKKEEANK